MENVVELKDMLDDAGYDGVSDFVRRSGVQTSFETVRKAVTGGPVSTWSLFLILVALRQSRTQIKNILERYGDTVLAPMLPRGEIIDAPMLPIYQAVQKVWCAAKQQGGDKLMLVSSALRVLAQSLGVDIDDEMEEALKTNGTNGGE